MKKKFSFFALEKILPYVKKYKKQLFITAATSLGVTAADIVSPMFEKYAVNHFVAQKTLDTLVIFIILYVLVLLFSALMSYISTTQAMKTEVNVNKDLRNAAFKHLQTLSFSYYNKNSVGYVHSRIMNDTSRIGELVSWGLLDGVWHVCYLFGAMTVMLIINLRLALYVMLIIPAIAVLLAVFQKKLVVLNRSVREINSRITGNFNEGISGAKTIKTLVAEQKIENDFTSETLNMKKTSVHASRFRGLLGGTMHFASSLALAVVLWQGGYIAQSELGTFAVFMTYAQGMMQPIRWIIDMISQLITTQVNIERFHELMNTTSDVSDSPQVVQLYGDSFYPKKENWEEIKGDIEFCDVSFKYPDGDEYVLEHFNLKIPLGTSVAIVGETGAGKSTLVNLVCRFFEPTSGKVLIDGVDARKRSQLWLHSALGYVLQTPHLFSGTVRENLLYANPDATQEEINSALEAVCALDTVNRLEHGLDTDVGEGGDLLSTGEKQLISFARAILAKPKIIVLDEATASVDTLTEKRVQAAINTVIRGRTSIVIAHRLSTIRDSDIILAVKNGKIVEQGTHEELIKKRGYYFDLYTRESVDDSVNISKKLTERA